MKKPGNNSLHVYPMPAYKEFVGNLAKQQNKAMKQMEEEFFQTARPTSLIRRFATTEEVASLVVYLASPLASATNGASMRVDGGLVKTII